MNTTVTIRGSFNAKNITKNCYLKPVDYGFTVSQTASLDMKRTGSNALVDPLIPQVGNQILIQSDVGFNSPKSCWYEKTNAPYLENMDKDEWLEMIRGGSGTTLFDNMDEGIINDPPASTQNRVLDFAICLRYRDCLVETQKKTYDDNTDDIDTKKYLYLVILATQIIDVDKVSFLVAHCGIHEWDMTQVDAFHAAHYPAYNADVYSAEMKKLFLAGPVKDGANLVYDKTALFCYYGDDEPAQA